ncbi:MAG TPA: STN domain-containing protein [Sphingobacteriaceae bacterium]
MRSPVLTLLICFLMAGTAAGQSVVRMTRYLYKPLDIDVRNAPLGDVLEGIAKKGNFYFSYSSSLIARDSLVTLNMKNAPVAQILDHLLTKRFEYRESPGYVILRPAFSRFEIVPETIRNEKRMSVVTGYVRNERTGEAVEHVSIYEPRLLRSTLTGREGFFRLKIRGNHPMMMISASRENYRDTTVVFLSGVQVGREGYADSGMFRSGASGSWELENSRLGRLLVSSRQKVQSLNLPDLLANTPYQASLLPGISSQGLFSSQVVNKFSLNVLGGYTAGVQGAEIAGLFNINKGDVGFIQVGGLSNVVGGSVRGVQIGGILNTVLGDAEGVQIGGVGNTVRDTMTGTQIGGVLSSSGNLRGIQVAGVGTLARKNAEGVQVAGVTNITAGRMRGVQIGLINAAREISGLQIGLINVARSSTGYSLGLINWVSKGYHKLVLSTNETLTRNVSIKTGNAKLYTSILAGMNPAETDSMRVYAAGLGLGHDFLLSRRVSISAEASSRFLYAMQPEEISLLNRAESNLQIRLFGPVTLFAGPSWNLMSAGSQIPLSGNGWKKINRPDGSGTPGRSWWGWNAGITLF